MDCIHQSGANKILHTTDHHTAAFLFQPTYEQKNIMSHNIQSEKDGNLATEGSYKIVDAYCGL